jgi:hypothetical protein
MQLSNEEAAPIQAERSAQGQARRHPPSIAPGLPDDVDVYLVLDDFGERLGRAWRETDEERTDRETVVRDLLEGQ